MKVLPETNLEKITQYIGRLRPTLAVIDSVQMIYNPGNPSAPGSVSNAFELGSISTRTVLKGIGEAPALP